MFVNIELIDGFFFSLTCLVYQPIAYIPFYDDVIVVTCHNICDWLNSREYCKLGHDCMPTGRNSISTSGNRPMFRRSVRVVVGGVKCEYGMMCMHAEIP